MARKQKVMPNGTKVVYKKKRGGKIAAGVSGGVLTGAALIYFFGGGLGMGLPSYSTGNSVPVSATVSDSSASDSSVPEMVEYELIVEEDAIKLDGQSTDLTSLGEALDALEGEYVVNLIDHNSIKATFEEVEGMLKEKNINYSVSNG